MGTGDYECEDPLDPQFAIPSEYEDYYCTTGVAPAIAMAMCNYNREYCSETREYTKDLTQSKSVFALTDMQAELSCSYKL